MPKIKFTTLVSDMKGKSQGSVFSTNRGGAYFRNNKAGTNKNSVAMGTRKTQMSALASSWRTLDSDQQDAWNNAVSLYPSVGAFGDVRIPTGYELYMSLNGALTAQDFSKIIVPAVPNEQPAFGAIEENYPLQFQFNPNQIVSLSQGGSIDSNSHVSIDNLFGSYDPTLMFTISFRALLSFDLQTYATSFTPFYLVQSDFGTGKELSLFMSPIDVQNVLLTLTWIVGGNTTIKDYTVPTASFVDGVSFAIVHLDGEISTIALFVDGSEYTAEITQSGTYEPATLGGKLYLGNRDLAVLNQFSVSDFRWYESELSILDLALVKDGYILGSEVWKLPLNGLEMGNILESFPTSSSVIASIMPAVNATSAIVPFSFLLIPQFTIGFENVGLNSSYVNIYASAPISNGRRGSLSSFKQVACVKWQFNNLFEMQSSYKAVFGAVPPNSLVRWYVQYLDRSTGQLDRAKVQVAVKKPRFKSGTELPDKVN